MAAKTADFSSKLKGLTQNRQALQDQMAAAHSELLDQIADLKAQRAAIAGTPANPEELVAVATAAVDELAESFEESQRQRGLGSLTAEGAAKLLRGPNVAAMQGAGNMKFRELAVQGHKAQLFSSLFRADATAEKSEISERGVLRFMAWVCRDEIVQRVQKFAKDLPDRSDQGVREAELGRLDAEIADLEEQAAQMRREASEAGLHLEAA